MNALTLADYCEKFLETEENFFVPVKKIFLLFKKSRRFRNLTYRKLCESLASDLRFSLYQGYEDFEGLSRFQKKKLAEMDYYSGPKVILKKRRPEEEKFFIDIGRGVDRVEESLNNILREELGNSKQIKGAARRSA